MVFPFLGFNGAYVFYGMFFEINLAGFAAKGCTSFSMV